MQSTLGVEHNLSSSIEILTVERRENCKSRNHSSSHIHQSLSLPGIPFTLLDRRKAGVAGAQGQGQLGAEGGKGELEDYEAASHNAVTQASEVLH